MDAGWGGKRLGRWGVDDEKGKRKGGGRGRQRKREKGMGGKAFQLLLPSHPRLLIRTIDNRLLLFYSTPLNP